jgi:choline dehydrogenase-like flavoprotein
MLSGIGAKAELAAAKIPMIVDLPSVGKNMSDHVLLGNPFTAMNLSDWIGEHLAPDHVNQDIATWLATKGGPLAGGTSNEIGYLRLPSSDATLKKYGDPSTGLTSGHYEMTFTVSPRHSSMRLWNLILSQSIFLDPTDPSTLDRPFLSIGTNLVSPTSRGTVSLNNNSPLSAPLINPNFLTTETDIVRLFTPLRKRAH